METKEFIRQQNNPGALLNVDLSGLEQYKNSKRTSRTMKLHEERIKVLEDTVEELKQTLAKILKVGQ